MELRHIRYFLAVHEERHFTRAAEKLGIAQPPLSQQIKALEAEVGTALFHRLPTGAILTEAGEAFLASVSEIPTMARGAIEAARRAARGQVGSLAIGITGTSALNPGVSAAIRRFRELYPEVQLSLEEANSFSLIDGVLSGRLDLALLRTSGSEPRELAVETLTEEPMLIALPAAWPELRDAPSEIKLRDFAERPLILTPRSIGTTMHDASISACRAAGFEPRQGQFAPQVASILTLVAAGMGFAVVPASMRAFAMAGIHFAADPGLQLRIRLGQVHRLQRPSSATLNFEACARAVFAERSRNPEA